MPYHLKRICLGLVDLVEERSIGIFHEELETVGIADSIQAARILAAREGYKVRDELSIPRQIGLQEARELLEEAAECGIESARFMTVLLPLLEEKARQRCLS